MKSSDRDPSRVQFFGEILEAVDEFPGTVNGSVWRVVLIREGWSKNGVYYSGQALRDAVPLFEGHAIQYYAFDSGVARHIPRTERVAGTAPGGNHAGVAIRPFVVETGGLVELHADFHCTHPILQEQLVRSAALSAQGVPIVLGFSIDADAWVEMGTAAGRTGPIVQQILAVLETTVVSNPAAGGRFLALMAGLEQQYEEENPMDPKLIAWLRSRLAPKGRHIPDGIDNAGLGRAIVAELQESGGGDVGYLQLALDWINAGKVDEAAQLLSKCIEDAKQSVCGLLMSQEAALAPVSAVAEAQKLLDEAKALVERAAQDREKDALRRCEEQLNSALASSGLAEKGQQFLRRQFGGRVYRPAELQEAVADLKEATAAARLGGIGITQPLNVSMGVGPLERQQVGWDLVFGYEPQRDPEYSGWSEAQKQIYRDMRGCRAKQLYAHFYDDHRMEQKIGPNAVLHEAVTADYPNIMANSMTKRVVQVYDEIPDASDDLVTIVDDIEDFKTQDRIIYGGFGDLPTVPESTTDDYPYLKGFEEKRSQYSVSKKGGLFAITWEMVLNDDLGVFRSLTEELGRAARHKKKKFFYGLITGSTGGAINTDTTYDSVVIYHASHANVSSSALSKAAVSAGRTAIRNQRRFSRTLTLGADYTSGGSSLTLTSTAGLGVGDYLLVEAEYFRVNSVTNGTVVAVSGGRLGSTPADHANGTSALLIADTIGVSKFHVLVPNEREDDLFTILNSELVPGSLNNDRNQMQQENSAGLLLPHCVDAAYLGGDVKKWYMVGDKTQVKTAEVGFLQGRRKPDILQQIDQLTGNCFLRDNNTFKIRFVFGGKVLDWKGLYSGQPSGG